MSPKASSLAVDEGKNDMVDDTNYQPKLSVFIKSRNGLVKYSVTDSHSKAIKIAGRITISF